MTQCEIRDWQRRARESFRAANRALREYRLDDAADLATQAAGEAGEAENAMLQYVAERQPSSFASGDSERTPPYA